MKTEYATRTNKAKKESMKSKWERFPDDLAKAARYQSPRLYRYLDRALDSRLAINLRSQFGTVPEDDGIGAWIALLRWNTAMKDPIRDEEEAVEAFYKLRMEPPEHPESLSTRLETARNKLASMGIDQDGMSLERRFPKAIDKSKEGCIYQYSLKAHKLMQQQAKSPSTEDLRTALTVTYEEAQSNLRKNDSTRIKERNEPPRRLVVAAATQDRRTRNKRNPQKPITCRNCGEKGHHFKECNPPPKCYKCNQVGNIAANCTSTEESQRTDLIATLICSANPRGTDTSQIFLDSACPIHIINDPSLLDNTTNTPIPLSFSPVTSHNLSISKVGTARIKTKSGVLRLEKAYLAKESPVNIISLGQLEKKGWKIALQNSKQGRYIAKGKTKFNVVFQRGYWTLEYAKFIYKPVLSPCLQCVLTTPNTREGSTPLDPSTWHKRLGHPSSRQMQQFINEGLAPKAAKHSHKQYHTCLATQSRSRSIPNTHEPSGENVVQVDYVFTRKEKENGLETGSWYLRVCSKKVKTHCGIPSKGGLLKRGSTSTTKIPHSCNECMEY